MRTDRRCTVRVGFRDYAISFRKKLAGGAIGLCDKLTKHDHEKGQIHVLKGLNDIEKANTVLHEIFHAIYTERGVNLSDKQEEQVVTAMTNGLIDFIRDNPRFLVRWLKLLKP